MAIETIRERMVVVWNYDGSFLGASLDERFVYEDGSTSNVQRPLSESDADDLLGIVDAAVIAERDSLLIERAQLRNQLAELRPPHNPRLIDPRSWYARLSIDNVIAIAKQASIDPNTASIVETLQATLQLRREDVAYRMSMDHPNAQNGIGYLVSIGILSADDGARMLSDSTADEQQPFSALGFPA